MAREVGWTAEAGMAGPESQRRLLERMGISADLQPQADWTRVQAEVGAGRPVTISTPKHYFTASGYEPGRGFYVGASGTDLKGGKEWLTATELAAMGGGVNGVIYLRGATQEGQKFLEANASPAGGAPSRRSVLADSAALAGAPSSPSRPPMDVRSPEQPASPSEISDRRSMFEEDPAAEHRRRAQQAATARTTAALLQEPERAPELPMQRRPARLPFKLPLFEDV